MSDPTRINRRRALRLLAACGAAVKLGVMTGCDSGPSGIIAAGNVSDLAVGSLQAVDSEAVAIGRDDAGVYAMTLICPHASCDMTSDGSVSASEVFCSCHGSVFDSNGGVVRGPAGTPLEHFAVSIGGNGDVSIDADSVVDPSTRAAVPA